MNEFERISLVFSLFCGVNLKATTDIRSGQFSQECYQCKFRENVPGNAHIKCVKPDQNMSGDKHGIRQGWFMYPQLFDPSWKTKKCENFESTSVNRAMSQETQVS